MSKIKGFIVETVIYGFANMFSRMFAFFLIPLYTSNLDKIQYSNLNMFQTTFTLLTFAFALNSGVFYYFYEYNNLKYKKIVFSTWIIYQIILATLFLLGLYFLSPYLVHIYNMSASNTGELSICLLLIGLQFFPFIFNNTLINYYRIDRKPKKVLVVVFLEALFTFILVYITFKLYTPSLINVLASQLVARLIVSLINMKQTINYTKLKFFSKSLLIKMIAVAWPYFLISSFNWAIQSFDRFIGVQTLNNKQEVAFLALANQLIMPVILLTGMVNQAIGPFIMAERNKSDASKSFQTVFELIIFIGCIVSMMTIGISPLLINILANKSYMAVLYIIPILGFSSIISMMYNQFCPAFTLVKRNNIIALASLSGSLVGVLINFLFMKKYGFITSGIAQLSSYLVMIIILYIIGKKVNIIKYELGKSLVIIAVLLAFVLLFLSFSNYIIEANIIIPMLAAAIFMIITTFIYFQQQKLSFMAIASKIGNKLKGKTA